MEAACCLLIVTEMHFSIQTSLQIKIQVELSWSCALPAARSEYLGGVICTVGGVSTHFTDEALLIVKAEANGYLCK